MATDALFIPGENCWRVETAAQAAIIVDYGNYYRAVFEAICQARKCIFITGWDVDSRIRLLRGDDAKDVSCPVEFYELIHWKARQNPELQIYINKWDYSIFFAKEREFCGGLRWRRNKPPNLHYAVDCMLPAGACHHQKIVVVDDAVAFSGGMDIALNRWDFREHKFDNSERQDPGGMNHPFSIIPYDPYHDIMMLVTGDAAVALGGWVRRRWINATGHTPMAPVTGERPCWPPSQAVQFCNVPVAIARTMPSIDRKPGVREIERLLLDEIGKAENFIYIENQFLTSLPVAQAIVDRLTVRPALRVLALSCDHPKGAMEKKSMWTGRVLFQDLITQGGVGDRVLLAWPASRKADREKPVRIHSKLLVIDDRVLHVGSANLNNRSMGLDSELDLSIQAQDQPTRKSIVVIRNDLIREHTGLELAEIEAIVAGGPVSDFLRSPAQSTQCLERIDDSAYRHERFQVLARRIADPVEPLIPGWLTVPKRALARGSWLPARQLASVTALIAIMVALAFMWKFTPLKVYASPRRLVPLIAHWRVMPLFYPVLICLYVAATLLFFPVVVLDASIVTAFGFPFGPLLALAGACISASCGYGIGRLLGPRTLNHLIGEKGDAVAEKARGLGLVGVAILRMVPLAPFTAVNLAIGTSRLSYFVFVLGSLLGLLPGLTVLTLLRGSLANLYHHPDNKGVGLVAIGLGAWAGLIFLSHKLSRRFASGSKA